MRNLISLLLIVAFVALAAAAQQKGRGKAPGREREAAAQRTSDAAQRRAQAVEILKSVVEGADEIRETESCVAVLSGALELLWKHDEAYARANFIKSADELLERFASGETKGPERSEIRAAVGGLLKAFARRDPRAAGRLLDQFHKLLEEVLRGGAGSRLSLGERLSLAQAGLESDPAQSAELAAKVLEAGVPGSFPTYLNELERRDAAAAAALFRTALSILAGRHAYNPSQVIVLSAYAFRESQMSVPAAAGGRGGAPLEATSRFG